MSEVAGAINTYTCNLCGWKAITINRVEGTTPFIIRCENLTCREKRSASADVGDCYSAVYRVPQSLAPTHEWYRPTTPGEKKKLKDPSVQRHVEMGGLLLRRIKTPDPDAKPAPEYTTSAAQQTYTFRHGAGGTKALEHTARCIYTQVRSCRQEWPDDPDHWCLPCAQSVMIPLDEWIRLRDGVVKVYPYPTQATIADLKNTLINAEWSDTSDESSRCCPGCGYPPRIGHSEGCWMATLRALADRL